MQHRIGVLPSVFLVVTLGACIAAFPLPVHAEDGWQPPPESAPSGEEPAHAADPESTPPQGPDRRMGKVDVELGGVASYMSAPIRGGTSPFGAGFGGRLGLDFGGFYVGARVVNYLGGSDVHLSDKALLYGLEIGFGFRLARVGGATLSLRPQVGAGDAAIAHTDPSLAKVDVVTSASGSSSSTSSDTVTVNSIYVQPGLTLMLVSGSNFVALNGSMLVIPSISYGGSSDTATWLTYGTQAELGFRF